MAGLAAVGVVRVGQVSDRLTVINDVNAVEQRYAINFRGSVHDRSIAVRDVVLSRTGEELQAEVDTITRLADAYSPSEGPMRDMFSTPEAVDADEVAALAGIEQVRAATLPMIQARYSFVDWLAAINQLIDLEESMNEVQSDEARAIASDFATTMIAIPSSPHSSPPSSRGGSSAASRDRCVPRATPWQLRPTVTSPTASSRTTGTRSVDCPAP